MILHNGGKYNGDESQLPQREHPEGYVPFKEAQTMGELAKKMNILCIIILIFTMGLMAIRLHAAGIGMKETFSQFGIGCALMIAALVPHEFLHALCFREDVYVYNNLKQGMLFVIGTEDMSKSRFIFLSLLPNVIFGAVPYVIFMIFPEFIWMGSLGALALSSGAGDYYNVYNAIKQVPDNALIYLSGMHSFWYIP